MLNSPPFRFPSISHILLDLVNVEWKLHLWRCEFSTVYDIFLWVVIKINNDKFLANFVQLHLNYYFGIEICSLRFRATLYFGME